MSVFAGNTTALPASSNGAPEQAATPHARPLCPLVFVPSDCAGWNAEYVPALDAALAEALNWWQTRLGVQPFDPEPALAIGGRQPRAAYACDTQERIRAELARYFPDLAALSEQAGTSVPCPSLSVPLYVVYALLSDLPYRCAGNVIGTSAAAAGGPPVLVVQSSGSLDAFALGQNPLDPVSGSRAAQIGALAHELGHALGLPHPADPAVQAVSVMWSWWLFPRVALSPPETAQALACLSG
ncbi:MAG TPA: hypothetical protein VKV26_06640 [Dehalococcoidia bacterium]|nr:hypothetical protein [Dehalococcoidia bacterium]